MNVDDVALDLLVRPRIVWSTRRRKLSQPVFIWYSLGDVKNVLITANRNLSMRIYYQHGQVSSSRELRIGARAWPIYQRHSLLR